MKRSHAPYSVYARYPTKHGKKVKIYYVKFWDYVNRKYETAISTGHTKQGQAIYWAEQELQKRKMGQVALIGDMTFREYSAPYYTDRCPHCARLQGDGRPVSPERKYDSRNTLNLHVFPHRQFSDLRMVEIGKRHGLDLRQHLLDTVGQTRTTQKAFQLVKTIFKEAELREDIPVNPLASIPIPKYKKESRDAFTREELKTLFFDDVDHFKGARLMFFTCACTGMRAGEVLGLRWQQINWEKNIILVDHQVRPGRTDLPKWGKIRTTALPTVLRGMLEEENRRHDPDCEYVFHDKKGQPHGNTYWRKHFIAALKSAKIDTEGRNLVPHSLRHSVSTLLTESGVDDRVIMASLGWNDARTKEGYTHIGTDVLKRHADAIDEAFSPGNGDSP